MVLHCGIFHRSNKASKIPTWQRFLKSNPFDQTRDDLGDAPSWFGESDDEKSGADRLRAAIGSPSGDAILQRGRLGEYQVSAIIGTGGMGTVYLGKRISGDQLFEDVALKVLKPELSHQAGASLRFAKESKLLAQLDHPGLTRLLEIGDDEGTAFFAMEFVDGVSLRELLARRGPLPETLALNVASHVASALAELHLQGIVHRDVKPANIMLVLDDIDQDFSDLTTHTGSLPIGHVKLTDFGLARHIDQTESMQMTKAGAIMGTPQYMAPEQYTHANTVDAASDVYAIGATLFEMLAGIPPIQCDSLVELIDRHRNSRPPLLNSVNGSISEAVSQVVAKALETNPIDRYANAGELLSDLDRLHAGVPIDLRNENPCLPISDLGSIQTYELTCDLVSSPESLWPFVSNTNRINRATDLPPVQFSIQRNARGMIEQYGTVRYLGMPMRWREHAYEWIEARQMSVLRVFTYGPIRWFNSSVSLHPKQDGGTRLVHRFELQTRGWTGELIAALQVRWRARAAFARVYHRIDAVLSGPAAGHGQVSDDAFENKTRLSARSNKRIDAVILDLRTRGIDGKILLQLVDYIRCAPTQALEQIRPIALAQQWGFDQDQVIDACLHAAHAGLLKLRWNIHCPSCRVPAAEVATLREVATHGRCDVCDLDFRTDIAHDVELVFVTEPKIRKSESQTYCVGGPSHMPHVVAQIRIPAGEQSATTLALCVGDYEIRSPQLKRSIAVRVSDRSSMTRCNVSLNPAPENVVALELSNRGQRFTLHNAFESELIVRVERTVQRKDVLRAGKVTSGALFRTLFSSEVLAVDIPVTLPPITFLVAECRWQETGTKASAVERTLQLQHFYGELRKRVAHFRGYCFKTVGGRSISVFYATQAAIDAAEELLTLPMNGIQLYLAIHRGAAVMATVNDQLEYFGPTLEAALRMTTDAKPGEILIHDSVAQSSDRQF